MNKRKILKRIGLGYSGLMIIAVSVMVIFGACSKDDDSGSTVSKARSAEKSDDADDDGDFSDNGYSAELNVDGYDAGGYADDDYDLAEWEIEEISEGSGGIKDRALGFIKNKAAGIKEGISRLGSSSIIANPVSDFSYDLLEYEGILIKDYTGGPGKVVIPARIEGIPVTEIGAGAFSGLSYSFNIFSDNPIQVEENAKAGITSVTIPTTVRKIDSEAFSYTAISKIHIPDSVIEIGQGLFSGCTRLTEIRLSDNIENLPDLFFVLSFTSVNPLKKINLPKNLKAIDTHAFSRCPELIELTIPATLAAFRFGNFSISNGILHFNEQAESSTFSNCSKLPLAVRQKLKDLGYQGKF